MKTIKELHKGDYSRNYEGGYNKCRKDVLKLIDIGRKNCDKFRATAMQHGNSLEASAHRGGERALEELKSLIEGK